MRSEVSPLEGALCTQFPVSEIDSIFFGRGAAPSRAKKICGNCPVKQECLEDVLSWELDGERHGTFGNMSANERQKAFAGTGPNSKDTCQSGLHEMVDDNVHVSSEGVRRCRACRLNHERKVIRARRGNPSAPADWWDVVEPSARELAGLAS